MTEKQLHELEDLAKPLAEWLRKNKNPYYSVIVSSQDIHLVNDVARGIIKTDRPQT